MCEWNFIHKLGGGALTLVHVSRSSAVRIPTFTACSPASIRDLASSTADRMRCSITPAGRGSVMSSGEVALGKTSME
jgi:hypothetical protein